MKPRSLHLLLHPYFFICLFLLLLNDFYLKFLWHNTFTGKLSDFTGLFVFSVFLIALLPYNKKIIVAGVALFFIWWKSSLSQIFLDYFNSMMNISLERVVDYTDYFALLILPFTLNLKVISPIVMTPIFRKALVCLSAIISVFAFCATSLPREWVHYAYRPNEVLFNEDFYSELKEDEILRKFGKGDEPYKKDSIRFYRITESQDLFYRKKDKGDSSSTMIPVNSADSSLYVKKTSSSFYTIPFYILNNDTLLNLEIGIYPSDKKKKQTRIRIESFQTNRPAYYAAYFYSKTKKLYSKHFKTLFRK